MAWKDPPILNSAICFPCTSTTLPEPEMMSAISHAFSSCSMAYFASQFFNANGHLKLQHRQWRLGSGLLQFVDHFGRQVQVGLGDQRIRYLRTIGSPVSLHSATRGSIGISPRNGTP